MGRKQDSRKAKHFERADDDELRGYALELEQLFDAAEAPEEIRDGWYSDESSVSEIFETCASRAEIDQTMERIGLVGVAGSSPLIDALKQLRERSRPN